MKKSKEDTRINRKERGVAADSFLKRIAEIYDVSSQLPPFENGGL